MGRLPPRRRDSHHGHAIKMLGLFAPTRAWLHFPSTLARGRAHLLACALVPLGCGELGGDILHSTTTPVADAQSQGDSGSAPPLSDGATSPPADAGSLEAGLIPSTTAQLDQTLGPWGSVEPPTPIAALASNYNDDDPTLTADMLELYYSSTRGSTSTDIWVSKRSAADAPWGIPAVATPLSTPDTEDTPEIAPDGLTLWFVRSVKGSSTGRDVYVSTRPTRSAAWSPGKLVAELSSAYEDYAPTPSSDGLTMVMSSYRPPSLGGDDLFSSHRASMASPWTMPSWIPVLESTARDSGPFRPGDDTLIYFTTWRNGLQIWRSTRPDASHPWAAPGVVSELSPNQSGAEEPWISADLHLIVFVTKAPNRPTQLAEARR